MCKHTNYAQIEGSIDVILHLCFLRILKEHLTDPH